jgi:gluconokinase
LGRALARKLGWDFFDGDDYHSSENIAKMITGIPLSDSDRALWLASLHDLLLSTLKSNRHPVLACSALKQNYRSQLLEGMEAVAIIYLTGSYELIWSRMSARMEHYMKPEMLQSQFNTLEEPENAFALDVSLPVEVMIDKITAKYFADKGF